jgi:hypothetical protein
MRRIALASGAWVRYILKASVNPQEMLMSRSSLYLTITIAFFLLTGCDDKKTQPSPRVEDKGKAPAVVDSSKPEIKSTADAPPRTVSPATLPRSLTTREEATKFLADLKSAIDRGKFSEADVALKALDAKKDQLPADLVRQLEALRTAYKSWPGNGSRK